MSLSNKFFSLCLALVSLATPHLVSARGEAIVLYEPLTKTAEGYLPLARTYDLTVTSPASQIAPVTVPLSVQIVSLPAGVAEAEALSFVTFSGPATLSFSAAAQRKVIAVTVSIPDSYPAGTYSYKLITTGWAGFVDPTVPTDNIGGYINFTVIPPPYPGNPPTVGITTPVTGSVYTYVYGGDPVQVPFLISGSSADATPVTALGMEINGQPVALTSLTGLNTKDASGTVSIGYTTAGVYSVRATATNIVGSSSTSNDFTVEVQVPPPTVTVDSPANGAVYDLNLGGDPLVIPVTISGSSLVGGVTTLSGSLNGQTITGLTASGLGTLEATATGSITITQPGTYTLGGNITDPNGSDADSISFTVNGILPPPTVSFLTPDDGLVVRRFSTDPASAVPFSFVALTDYGVIESVTLTIASAPAAFQLTGAGTADVGGVGTFTTSTAGTYVFNVTVQSNGFVASDSLTVRVVEDPLPPPDDVACGSVEWLVPVVLNKTVEGGSTVPVKFRIFCNGVEVVDPEVIISVSEQFGNGSTGDPQLFPWGNQPTGGTYKYTGNKYHLDFVTAVGVHTYRVEVYRPVSPGSSVMGLLDFREINTTGKDPHCGGKSDKSKKSGKSDKSDKSDKSCKSDKSAKSDKSYKSEKSAKSGKSDQSCKSAKSSKSGKSDKSSKSSGKSVKSSTSEKSDKGGKSDKSGKSGKATKGGKSDQGGDSSKKGKSSGKPRG